MSWSERLDVEGARHPVGEVARVTPCLPAVALSEALGREVWVKAECLQVTGSFKVRGVANRLAALDSRQRAAGVITCSSGNHGRAISYVSGRMGIPATVFLPEWVDPTKVQAMRESGAELRMAGSNFDEAEAKAKAEARESGRVFVSAYDDPWVIAGQGTIGFELLDQLDEAPAAIVAPLSGGGLIGGVAAALRSVLEDRAPRIVASSAERAAVMLASVDAGRPIELPEEDTLASALAGGIGLDNEVSFDLVNDVVDEHVTVTEEQIADAMRYAMAHLRLVVEGGGAVGLAALTSAVWSASELDPGPIVVLLSGGNVDPKLLAGILRG